MKPILILSAFYITAMASPALAYIDPVTGSFVLQAIIGGFATALVAIRRVRERLMGLLGLKSATANADDVVEDRSNS